MPDPSRTELKEAAVMRVRLLVGGQVVLLGALLRAAAAVQVRCAPRAPGMFTR